MKEDEVKCLRILSILFSRSVCREFRKPVDVMYPQLVTVYKTVIDRPMDLGSLLLQCMKGQETPSSVREKLQLIFQNAIEFNKDALDMVAISKHLNSFAGSLYEEILNLPYTYTHNYHIPTRTAQFSRKRIHSRIKRYDLIRNCPLRDSELHLLIDTLRYVSPLAVSSDVLQSALKQVYELAMKAWFLHEEEPGNPTAAVTLVEVLEPLLTLVKVPVEGALSAEEEANFVVENGLPAISRLLSPLKHGEPLKGPATAEVAAGREPLPTTGSQTSFILPVSGPYKEYLLALDQALSELLAVCIEERALRGCPFSSVWARPAVCAWVQPPKLPWWPVIVLASGVNGGVDELLGSSNISRLPKSIVKQLVRLCPKPTATPNGSCTSSSSMAVDLAEGTSVKNVPSMTDPDRNISSSLSLSSFVPLDGTDNSSIAVSPSHAPTESPSHTVPSALIATGSTTIAMTTSKGSKEKASDKSESIELRVPEGVLLVEFFGTHDFGWIKASHAFPITPDGHAPPVQQGLEDRDFLLDTTEAGTPGGVFLSSRPRPQTSLDVAPAGVGVIGISPESPPLLGHAGIMHVHEPGFDMASALAALDTGNVDIRPPSEEVLEAALIPVAPESEHIGVDEAGVFGMEDGDNAVSLTSSATSSGPGTKTTRKSRVSRSSKGSSGTASTRPSTGGGHEGDDEQPATRNAAHGSSISDTTGAADADAEEVSGPSTVSTEAVKQTGKNISKDLASARASAATQYLNEVLSGLGLDRTLLASDTGATSGIFPASVLVNQDQTGPLFTYEEGPIAAGDKDDDDTCDDVVVVTKGAVKAAITIKAKIFSAWVDKWKPCLPEAEVKPAGPGRGRKKSLPKDPDTATDTAGSQSTQKPVVKRVNNAGLHESGGGDFDSAKLTGKRKQSALDASYAALRDGTFPFMSCLDETDAAVISNSSPLEPPMKAARISSKDGRVIKRRRRRSKVTASTTGDGKGAAAAAAASETATVKRKPGPKPKTPSSTPGTASGGVTTTDEASALASLASSLGPGYGYEFGGATTYACGDGVIHSRFVNFNAPIFFLENKKTASRKAILRQELETLADAITALRNGTYNEMVKAMLPPAPMSLSEQLKAGFTVGVAAAGAGSSASKSFVVKRRRKRRMIVKNANTPALADPAISATGEGDATVYPEGEVNVDGTAGESYDIPDVSSTAMETDD